MIILLLQNICHCFNVQNLSTSLADCIFMFTWFLKLTAIIFVSEQVNTPVILMDIFTVNYELDF